MFSRALTLLAPAVCAIGALAQTPSVSFDAHIRPLLEARCLKCHGQTMQMGKLDLRTAPKSPVLVPGKPLESTFYRRIAGLAQPAMPMDGKLTESEVQAIRKWIEDGATWQSNQPALASKTKIAHWAFELPRKPAPPGASAHPIDAFLTATLKSKGLRQAPPASDATLVRRAFLDLTGLPPTPADVRAYIADSDPKRWDKLIAKLLDSPHYGERWGRHWLDVARYADSNGYEHDFDRPNAWRYRDYVINAFNRNKPFNRFLIEQIAGDELDQVNYETLTATGFLRSYAKVDFREKSNPQFRYDYLDDMIATLGRGVLGLTIQCARCHDHKFDPIPQRDYYAIQTSLYGYVEIDHPLVPEPEAKAWREKSEDVAGRVAAVRSQLREIEAPYRAAILDQKYKRYPENVQEAIRTSEDKRTPGQKLLADQVILTVGVAAPELERRMSADDLAKRKALLDQIKEIERERPAPIPVAAGITDGDYRFAPDGPGDEPAPGKARLDKGLSGSFLHQGPGVFEPPASHLLRGGDMTNPGERMQPGFLTVVSIPGAPAALPPAHGRTSGRRRALAEWLASPQNPLTARVFVNRVWHHHFGRGLVATLDNFGTAGDQPTHPELLDWLATAFIEDGWDIKQLHKRIMTSKAYRMASAFNDEGNLAQDAGNDFLWRFRPQRLEAEIVRDQVLAVAGTLNATPGGPAVFPKLPHDVLASMRNGIWRDQPDGPETWRRSVYVYRKRGLPFPLFEVFDLPDQNLSCGRRNVSTVATQALTLMNNDFLLNQSRLFAVRLEKLVPDDKRKQAELAFSVALGRDPDASERDLILSFTGSRPLSELTHVLFNLSEFLYMR